LDFQSIDYAAAWRQGTRTLRQHQTDAAVKQTSPSGSLTIFDTCSLRQWGKLLI